MVDSGFNVYLIPFFWFFLLSLLVACSFLPGPKTSSNICSNLSHLFFTDVIFPSTSFPFNRIFFQKSSSTYPESTLFHRPVHPPLILIDFNKFIRYKGKSDIHWCCPKGPTRVSPLQWYLLALIGIVTCSVTIIASMVTCCNKILLRLCILLCLVNL